jgi:hypothetical protein
MKRRIRSASARSRIGARSRSGTLETHEPADQRVVPRMRGIAVFLAEHRVKALFRPEERLGNRDADAPEPGCTDRDKKRLDRLDAGVEVTKSLQNQVFAWK